MTRVNIEGIKPGVRVPLSGCNLPQCLLFVDQSHSHNFACCVVVFIFQHVTCFKGKNSGIQALIEAAMDVTKRVQQRN
jgi:hypothetical protein